jgi:membrane associated rhomboid family serine protease
MIPLRDDVARRLITPVNSLLILFNAGCYILETFTSAMSGGQFALVPIQLAHGTSGGDVLWPATTLMTSLFLHAGIVHLAGNMLYLFIFGPAIEERLGHFRFLIFYLLAGIVSGLAMVAMSPQSAVPVVGASGAIAGILGAYLVLNPGARLATVLPWPIRPRLVRVPAVAYLLIWFAVQLAFGASADGRSPLPGGVAWWAHVGGFLSGLALGPLLAHPVKPRRRSPRR